MTTPRPEHARGWLGGVLSRVARASFQTRLILFGSLLTALVVGSAFLSLIVIVNRSTRRLFTEELGKSLGGLGHLQEDNLRELWRMSSMLTEDPTLVAAMETYRVEARSGRGTQVRAQLLETIQRELQGLMAGLDRDLLIVTDQHGRVLAAGGRGRAYPPVGEDLSGLPVVRRALDVAVPSDSLNVGVARFGGGFFQVSGVAILLQDIPVGTLVLGEQLDAAFAGRLGRSFAADVVVATPAAVLASTIPAIPVGGRMPPDRKEGTVTLGEEEFVSASLPLGRTIQGDTVSLSFLHPLSAALAPLHRTLLSSLIGLGLLAVLLAGVGAGAAARSVLAPFRAFVDFMEHVAATGDHTRRFLMAGPTAEIRTLNASYQRLIDSVAQKHAEVEQRTQELSTTNTVLRQEISEREQAERALRVSEEQLRQSQKLEAIGTLAGGVAHDFNNLLTVMLSYLQLAMIEISPDAPVHDDLEQARLAATRAAGLTRQLLAFSRKQVLQPRILDLGSVVRAVEAMLRRVIGEDINLQTSTEPGLPRVEADPGQLEQVVLNLAINARDAMPQGGVLSITTSSAWVSEAEAAALQPMRPGRWVVLTVSDSGMGMDEATCSRIFEPFFTTKESGKGTGLGLSTVYGIVKQSGGFIWVDSAPGAGSRFRVFLPIVERDEEALAFAPGSNGARGGSETVLLVEDEAPVRGLARRVLEHAGYRVLEAAGAAEALALAAAPDRRIDLLLTDVVMPNMSGRVLVERLSSIRPELKTLYMSGYTDEAVARHGLLDASTQVLEKPFTPDLLIRKVREVLDLGRRHDPPSPAQPSS